MPWQEAGFERQAMRLLWKSDAQVPRLSAIIILTTRPKIEELSVCLRAVESEAWNNVPVDKQNHVGIPLDRTYSMVKSKSPPKARGPHLQRQRDSHVKLDRIDLLILSALQGNARVSNAEIARRAKMVPSGIFERLRRLAKKKVILGYETRIDPHVLGLELVAFVYVTADDRIGNMNTAAELAKIPEVQEVHNVAGEDCYLLKLRVASPQELGRIVRDKVRSLKSVLGTKTTIVLDTLKETSALPLPENQQP
jgi:Lrp/AsnC family transcriptional regulator, leucine-responsive regulatory protein